ncbi:MAG: membrane protein insertase YidC [Gammaproteobacteria bacterium]|nr:membrane protein insertase YidC [Gammaproteobacteria bacterium]
MQENILDYIRIALYSLLLVLGLFLYQAWNQDHPPQTILEPSQPANSHFVPTVPETGDISSVASAQPLSSAPETVQASANKSEQVTVTTDYLEAVIDTKGGDIISIKLLKYPESLHSKIPYVLLNDDPKTRYLAESGLISKDGPDTRTAQANYTVSQKAYLLAPDQNQIVVPLSWENGQGLKVNKFYTFTRGSYEVKVGYQVENNSAVPYQGNVYAQLMRTDAPPPSQSGLMSSTFFGAAVSSPDKPFQKIPFKDMQEKSIHQTVTDGWAAMVQHYFISAFVPDKNSTSTYYSKVLPNGLYAIGLVGQPITVAPGTKQTTGMKLYTGPIIGDELTKVSPTLKLTIDYGWFWFISGIIFWMMQKIYNVVGNWGWSIVLVTIVIKLLFYQLSAKSYRSMSALKRLQPRIEKLKERFGEDRQKLTQATLELYKQEKVNPMSGCLPVLIQIPVFLALYWVLVESVQLRQAPFILWIKDLSQADPYYILPILMGISMFLQQRLSPPPPDPMQAKIMMLIPVISTVLFINFPAGLMLYWFVNNTLSFLQQWYVMRTINAPSNLKVKTLNVSK